MPGLHHMLRVDNKKLSFVAGLVVAVVGLAAAAGLAVNRVSAADCDDNAIIKCGFTTPQNFVDQVKANSTQNGHHDLPAFYNDFNFSSADYQNFVSHAVLGEARRDGSIWVTSGGKKVQVLTGGVTFGRSAAVHSPNATVRTIGGVKYYGNVPDITFKDGVQSIPIYVLFDAQGTMKFAVMPACGNPEVGKVVSTGVVCNALNVTPVAGKVNTYSFTAKATPTGVATIKSYEYSFGDGSKPVVTTNPNEAVTHTYTKTGHFTASVTVHASVPGNDDLQVTTTTLCTKVIDVAFYSCVQLVGAILDKSKLSYSFTVTATSGNGAVLTGADFDFGDGNTQAGVKPASATTATATHNYATGGNYNASAVVHFSTPNGDVTAPTCKALVTPESVTPECKPGVPVGSAECSPCIYNSNIPSESADCKPPELPKTGAGNTIAIFAVVIVAGFLVYRQLLFRRHRAAFLAAQNGTSPLPLGDPLNDEAPLAGTPLASTKRATLRRKRHF